MTRVVIVHDYLTQRGGAERVVLAMLEAFPDARLITSFYDPRHTYPEFRSRPVETLIPRLPVLGRDPRLAFPILPAAFGRHTVTDADVVLCSSSGWSHGIRTTAPKIVYCHTPARWLYQSGDYVLGHRLGFSFLAAAARPALRNWDVRAAASARLYLANSTTVAERVKRIYGQTADVLHPPLALDPAGSSRALLGVPPSFLLTIARDRGYKNTETVVEAARRCGVPLVVVGAAKDSSDLTVVRDVDDAVLRWLYRNCRALVAAAYEDFGLTPVEAMAFGKPVLALRGGGYLDTVVDGVSGIFFDESTPAAIAAAISALDAADFDAEAIRRESERFSLKRFVSELRRLVADATA